MMNRERQNEYDRIAASRLSKIDGGIPRHIALSNRASITLRNKFKRMGLEGQHIEAAITMIDEIGIQGVLERQSLGVRFSTTPHAKRSPKIWRA
jgi:hypothetical protein